MENITDHCRHMVRYHFHIGLCAVESTRRICAVYGYGAIKEEVVQEWFSSLQARNFNHEDTKRSKRSTRLVGSVETEHMYKIDDTTSVEHRNFMVT
ncbi:Histone-lysine N-methyltransferase SETMAR-like [Tropilaelaps mercedesae]|uniref:Histone-lysine N-methyltransferase SETMAR-like n=1 Tax=Tropilaelaps mercedesae TaxID=418985 RepID=A0A1V9XVT7_9ACAR|nr:Histone-lysine N-methyltransferase SETMAR-like [Tropilaelaps mercedesae]